MANANDNTVLFGLLESLGLSPAMKNDAKVLKALINIFCSINSLTNSFSLLDTWSVLETRTPGKTLYLGIFLLSSPLISAASSPCKRHPYKPQSCYSRPC